MSNKLELLIEGRAPFINKETKIFTDGRKFTITHYEFGRHQEKLDCQADTLQQAYNLSGLYLMPPKYVK